MTSAQCSTSTYQGWVDTAVDTLHQGSAEPVVLGRSLSKDLQGAPCIPGETPETASHST